jgi:hypothetical protein
MKHTAANRPAEVALAGRALWSGPLPPHYVHNIGTSNLQIIAIEIR